MNRYFSKRYLNVVRKKTKVNLLENPLVAREFETALLTILSSAKTRTNAGQY